MWINWSHLAEDCAITVARVLAASLLSWICGVGLGILFFRQQKVYSLFLPLINFMRQISPFVWLPFAIILFGLGEIPVGTIMIVAMLFPAIVMTYETLLALPRDVCEEAIVDGASSFQLLLYIQLPLAMTSLINIYRIIHSVGWSTVIAAEMLGVSKGLGFRLLDFRYLLSYKPMFVYILVIGFIGIAGDKLLHKIISAHRF